MTPLALHFILVGSARVLMLLVVCGSSGARGGDKVSDISRAGAVP